jgi:hypothetical protein
MKVPKSLSTNRLKNQSMNKMNKMKKMKMNTLSMMVRSRRMSKFTSNSINYMMKINQFLLKNLR